MNPMNGIAETELATHVDEIELRDQDALGQRIRAENLFQGVDWLTPDLDDDFDD